MKQIYKYTVFVFILCNGLAVTQHANAQQWAWAKCDSESNLGEGNSVTTDAAGNVYVAGYFASPTATFGAITLTNSAGFTGNNNLFIVKYDTAGNVIWAQNALGTGVSMGYSITADVTGNLYVAGVFSSSLTFGTTTLIYTGSVGGGDMFLAKYDSAGNVIWAIDASNDSNGASSVITDATGNVYVDGTFKGKTLKLGAITLTNSDTGGLSDVFIAKYDSSGNVIWARSAGGTGGGNSGAITYSLTTDSTANVYINGIFDEPTMTIGTTTLINTSTDSSFDIFLAKYDSSGNFKWATSAHGADDDFAYSVITDAAGNVYIAGSFNSPTLTFGSITLTDTSSSYMDIFLAKYDTAGNVIWSRMAGGASDDYGQSIAIGDSGYIYMTGNGVSSPLTFGTISLINNDSGSMNIFIAKYDTAGNAISAINTGIYGGSSDYSVSIATAVPANVYITGCFNTMTDTFGSTTLIKNGESNMFVAKCDEAVLLIVPIRGDSTVCTGDSISLSDVGSGGVWSSSSTSIAIVGSGTGMVTGLTPGVAIIMYTVGSSYVTQAVTVNPSPSAIIGNTSLCVDTMVTLTDATIGGMWSSSNTAVGTVGSTGIVTGLSGGITIITYTVPTGCYVTMADTVSTLCGDGVPIITGNNYELDIYPNPAITVLLITSSENIIDVTISNLLGQIVIPSPPALKSRSVQIDVSNLPDGVYFVKVNGSEVRKFVKE